MNPAEGETKGTNFYKVVISPSRCTGALGQKQIHLEILLLGLSRCCLDGFHEKPGDI